MEPRDIFPVQRGSVCPWEGRQERPGPCEPGRGWLGCVRSREGESASGRLESELVECEWGCAGQHHQRPLPRLPACSHIWRTHRRREHGVAIEVSYMTGDTTLRTRATVHWHWGGQGAPSPCCAGGRTRPRTQLSVIGVTAIAICPRAGVLKTGAPTQGVWCSFRAGQGPAEDHCLQPCECPAQPSLSDPHT